MYSIILILFQIFVIGRYPKRDHPGLILSQSHKQSLRDIILKHN